MLATETSISRAMISNAIGKTIKPRSAIPAAAWDRLNAVMKLAVVCAAQTNTTMVVIARIDSHLANPASRVRMSGEVMF